MAKPRILLKLRKAVTGKRATPKELGYERNPKTGRLTKPGAAAFNEKVQFTTLDKKLLLSEYNRRIKTANFKEDADIYRQKKIDRKKQYDRKIADLRIQRAHDKAITEKRRLADLKKRQLKDWIQKLDAVLKNSRKPTVNEFKEKLFKELFTREIEGVRNKGITSSSRAKQAYEYLHNSFITDFYNELHRSYVPANISKMSAKNITEYLTQIAQKTKAKKDRTIYREFRTGEINF